MFAGLIAFLCWFFGALPDVPYSSFFVTEIPNVVLSPEATAIALGSVAVVVGLSTRRFGIRRCWLHFVTGSLLIAITSILALRFFAIDLLPAPTLLAGMLSALLVQMGVLWELDRHLATSLFRSPRGTELVQSGEAQSRLNSGLKLINTVLPITEAVVFQRDTSIAFQPVARFTDGVSNSSDPGRNSIWRDGVRLCQRAVKLRRTVQQVDPSGSSSSIAVPLQHELDIVGALLVRLSGPFCEDNQLLLEAFGSQFARNLARDSFSKDTLGRSLYGFFSTSGSKKKLEALHVLHALATEQRSEQIALASIDDGVAIAYLDGTIAFANAAMSRCAGAEIDEIRTLDVFTLLNRFRVGVFDEPSIAVRRVLQTGCDYESELRFEDANKIIGLKISLLRESRESAGEPIGLAIIIKDLTAVKEYDKLKSDMISLMSHELRTPLTSINGFAELLSSDNTIPDQAKEFVTIIANESQRMSRMINTFLSVTQLQRKDKQEVLKIPLRLDEVVHDTISTLQPVAKKKRIRLIEQPTHRLPPVAADKSLITQVVKNLLSNAIKYSPERTTVTVSTALEAESVRVSVEDRGFGIPSESKDRVWEKFYRVVREGQEKDEESTGLGLSFVRQVIEQHGGTVEVDSEEGRGSKFSFTLPRL